MFNFVLNRIRQSLRPLSCLACALLASLVFAQEVPKDYADAATYLNKKGDYKANVFKLGIPRNDLHMRVDGVDLPTAFGFGGWVAMTKGDGGKEVMMGDLVLLESEVNPVMSALLENGLEVTALHNHFFFDTPKVYYMHVHGMGSADELSHRLKPALDLIGKGTPGITLDMPATTTPAGTIDTASLDKIVGSTGESNGAVYKYTMGRSDLEVKEMGATINARMGLNTWAAFFGSDDNAVVAGDIAMLPEELTPVLKALRSHNLSVVAIHQHMAESKPMILFLHYWGKGSAAELAKGFRAAVDVLGHSDKMSH
jgi:hypothetical protein